MNYPLKINRSPEVARQGAKSPTSVFMSPQLSPKSITSITDILPFDPGKRDEDPNASSPKEQNASSAALENKKK